MMSKGMPDDPSGMPDDPSVFDGKLVMLVMYRTGMRHRRIK
jgi:hypothetical protein